MIKKSLQALSCSCLLILAWDCTKNDNIVGNTSETGNVVGKLRRSDGSTAAGVTVYFYNVDNNPRAGLAKVMAATDSTMTDSAGNFTDSLPDGQYNMVAGDDTTGVYQDSVEVAGDTATFADDTLKPFGSLAGVVRLQPGHDSRKVFLLVMGTDKWAAPSDSVGNFSLANMAEGGYSVRILSTLDDYGVLDTTLGIIAGTDTSLVDTIFLPYTGIPVPKGLTITYDTLKQLVTLAWNTPTTGRTVQGYNVYRKHIDSTSFAKIAGTIVDTIYTDSSAVQDQIYTYKVAAVDTNDTEGTRSGANSVVVATFLRLDSVYGENGSGQGEFDDPRDVAIDKYENIYIADYGNNRIQVYSKEMVFQSEFGSAILSRPYRIGIDSSLNVYVSSADSIVVFDSSRSVANTFHFSDFIYDLETSFGQLFVRHGSDSVVVTNLQGQRIRGWRGPNGYYHGISVTNGGQVYIGNGIQQITVTDTLGSEKASLEVPLSTNSIAYDNANGRIYINSGIAGSNAANAILVYNEQRELIAQYFFKDSYASGGYAIGVNENGTIFAVSQFYDVVLQFTLLK